MQVLIVDEFPVFQSTLGVLLRNEGLQVTQAHSAQEALAHLRCRQTQLLVLREKLAGQSALSVALAAEFHRPDVATVLLSDRSGEDGDELFELVPSLACVMGEECRPTLVQRFALSALESKRETLREAPVFISRRRRMPIPA